MFSGFGEKMRFFRFWRENCVFSGFGEKMLSALLAGKCFLEFWREYAFLEFWWKNAFFLF